MQNNYVKIKKNAYINSCRFKQLSVILIEVLSLCVIINQYEVNMVCLLS